VTIATDVLHLPHLVHPLHPLHPLHLRGSDRAMTAPNAFGPEAAEAAAREVVRTAEQTVSDAWIGRLLSAESEADAVVGSCARVRERATDQVRAAQQAGDLTLIVHSQDSLELADAAWYRALDARAHAGTRLASELEMWSENTAHRVRQALSDQAEDGMPQR
jgi:hypothetical protein